MSVKIGMSRFPVDGCGVVRMDVDVEEGYAAVRSRIDIDIVYTSLENIIEERNDLLQLFNSRINDNIPNENIFHDDVYVDADNRFKLIFVCKSEPNDIYKYIFHIFIKSDFNNINLKFIINN